MSQTAYTYHINYCSDSQKYEEENCTETNAEEDFNLLGIHTINPKKPKRSAAQVKGITAEKMFLDMKKIEKSIKTLEKAVDKQGDKIVAFDDCSEIYQRIQKKLELSMVKKRINEDKKSDNCSLF